jgi:alpha-tubulin suppressor-like RCC1 family protein
MRWTLGLWLAVLAACIEPATQVIVWVDIPEASEMRARATRMQVRVFDRDEALVLEDQRRLSGDAPVLAPPISISVVPRDHDASRRFRIEVSLIGTDPMGGDAEFARQTAESAFVRDELREIWLRFDDACLDVTCGFGRTCIDGGCERACFDAVAPGTTTRSDPGGCPCDCACDGDTCVDGFCIPRAPVSSVVAGVAHACAIAANGALHCWGDNASGQLGLGDRDRRAIPTRVDLPPVAMVSLGESHTCAILEDQSLWCWGSNAARALGTDGGDELLPHRVDERAWATVGAGARHTCATTASGGEAWCWGDNELGQTGSETTGTSTAPAPIMVSGAALGGLTEILAGTHHTCARQGSASRLWCWGSNSNGVLGRQDPIDSTIPNPIPEQVVFPDPSGVRQAAAGGWHMVAVSGADEVFVWGDEANGRLGMPVPDGPGVRMPARLMSGTHADAGLRHTCVIHDRGALSCFGQNERGEVGVASDALILDTPQLLREEGWERLGLGSEFTCGVRRGGALHCWGSNANCRLGIGEPCEAGATPITRRTPARVCL